MALRLCPGFQVGPGSPPGVTLATSCPQEQTAACCVFRVEGSPKIPLLSTLRPLLSPYLAFNSGGQVRSPGLRFARPRPALLVLGESVFGLLRVRFLFVQRSFYRVV